MPATVVVNFMTVVHDQSGGMAMFFPDACLTPSPAGPIPIPYPNIAQGNQCAEGTSSVKADGCPLCIQGSKFSMSSGDEAGSAGGGVVTANIKGKAEFMNFSFDVKADGKGVARLLDPMVGNEMSGQPGNTPPSPELQSPLPGPPPPPPENADRDVA